jgi:hypothetical protein
VSRNLLMGFVILALSGLAAACNRSAGANTNDNINASAVATTTTRPGPDNSEIITTTDARGVKTETRVFRDNPRVSRVVVTTRDGYRTVKVYSRSGEERELNKDEPEDVLEATGDAIADSAGFVAKKTGEAAKTAGEETAEGAKVVGQKTAKGVKKVGEETAEGAKKAGKAIKKVVTP